MNELHCVGRRERTHAPGTSRLPSPPTSPQPGLVPAPAKPALPRAGTPAPGSASGVPGPRSKRKYKRNRGHRTRRPWNTKLGGGGGRLPTAAAGGLGAAGTAEGRGGEAHLDRRQGGEWLEGGGGPTLQGLPRGGDRRRCTSGARAGVGGLPSGPRWCGVRGSARHQQVPRARAPLGPARREKGGDAQLSLGFFLGWRRDRRGGERGLGKGRVLTPRRRLGSGSEPLVGAGRGWGRGRGSRWAARAPGSCGGRGRVPGGGRRRGTGRGHAGPTPRRTRRARAHSRSGARPADPAQAQAEAAWGAGGGGAWPEGPAAGYSGAARAVRRGGGREAGVGEGGGAPLLTLLPPLSLPALPGG